ncbi:MAG TPA: fibronectin type III domain-containing protein, partial [Bacteroidales bacterium]|nr:fibronectin type III domain-containing protein [Bacteroidales bacterium]
MKNLFNVPGLILAIILTFSCEEKSVPPSLSTTIVTAITTTTAVSGGNITADGGAPIIARGVCWNTSDNPTVDNSKTIENGDLASFNSNITQLTPNTSYYVRAYATNSAGTGYGESVSFKT